VNGRKPTTLAAILSYLNHATFSKVTKQKHNSSQDISCFVGNHRFHGTHIQTPGIQLALHLGNLNKFSAL